MEPVLQFLISYYTDPALNLNTDPDPAFFVTAELLKKGSLERTTVPQFDVKRRRLTNTSSR